MKIEIEYCVPCGYLPRATDAQTRILEAFGNRVDQLPDSYLRYLINGIRRELDFGSVPVRLHARSSRNPFDR